MKTCDVQKQRRNFVGLRPPKILVSWEDISKEGCTDSKGTK